MRRGVASLIVGLSLIVASLSWAGFTLSRTILDPGRSERLAFQLLDNPDVRTALTSRLADTLESQIPDDVPVPRAAVEAGAEIALDDPRVRALVVDGFVRVHQNALEGRDEPVTIDAGAIGAAGRDALVQTRPELDPFLPPAPSLDLDLPTTGLSWMGTLKQFVDRYTLLGALGALAGVVGGFLIAKDRPPVLRRIAYWGFGAAAFWIAVGFVVPWVASLISPTSAAIATAAVDVFFGAMIRPAVVVAAVSAVLLAVGIAWPAVAGRRGGRMLQPASRGSSPTATPAPTGVGSGPSGPAAVPARPPVAAAPGPIRVTDPSPTPQQTPRVDVAPPAPTAQPIPSAPPAPVASPPPMESPVPSAPPAPATSPPPMAAPTTASIIGDGRPGATRSWDPFERPSGPAPVPTATPPGHHTEPNAAPSPSSTDAADVDRSSATTEADGQPSTAWRAGYGYLDNPGVTQPMPPDDPSATRRSRP
ncbi:MAG: hypothetical protein AAF547_09320 [Actinomycetota bacterium]